MSMLAYSAPTINIKSISLIGSLLLVEIQT
jgi:hypothetical protein